MLFSLLKRIFGTQRTASTRTAASPPLHQKSVATFSEKQASPNQYFAQLEKLQTAISSRKYQRAAALTLESMKLIPDFVRKEVKEYGRFNIQRIPVLEQGGTMLALQGDTEGLREMQRLVGGIPELKQWVAIVDQHVKDQGILEAMIAVITNQPGCLQSNMKTLIGAEDAGRVAVLLSWLEKAGVIVRTKQGKAHSLRLASKSNAAQESTKSVGSHRPNTAPCPVREICIEELPFVPLPRAPVAWDESRKKGAAPVDVPAPFIVPARDGWQVASITKLPMNERPDPAFRQLYFINTGLLMVDDLGNSEQANSAPAAVLRYGRSGNLDAQGVLHHDIYRFCVNAFGRGFIAMSKDCVAHAYDDSMRLILETSLSDAPEVGALQKRAGWQSDQLKNLLRCVALSHDNSRYLFTGMDEAACVDMEGKSLWRVRLPLKEGWQQVSGAAQVVSTDKEIFEALKVMNLTLPFTPDDLKRRYRELAKQYHPDLHPNDLHAEARMKSLVSAAEKLTGIDSTALNRYTGAAFSKVFSRQTVTVPGAGSVTLTFSLGGGLASAADWIYAANFCGRSHGALLASYSGKIVEVNERGEPVRAYDVGAVPRQIIDTGDYLYFLTDTRLYVLRGEALHAVVDVFDRGELLMTQNGFGLLEKSRFRWFSEGGTFVNELISRNPIRRVYASSNGVVVETREHRAIITGPPKWWE